MTFYYKHILCAVFPHSPRTSYLLKFTPDTKPTETDLSIRRTPHKLEHKHEHAPARSAIPNSSVIVNTGSKQGITNPPGNAAYNASKAAVKSLTENLAFELRQVPNTKLTAHLFMYVPSLLSPFTFLVLSCMLIYIICICYRPGWTHTSISTSGLTPASSTPPPGAWSASETVLYMLDKVRSGTFYILCPDGETRPEVDRLRILWGAGDLTEGRPALSRWHPDWKSLFEEWMREGLAEL